MWEIILWSFVSLFWTDFHKFQNRFWKDFIAQHCLIVMITKWKQYLDSFGQPGALLVDISKLPNCINPELIWVKLYEHGIDDNFLKSFFHSSESQQKQSNKINTSYSTFASILFWAPKGSIFRPLLINTNICNFLFE